MKSGDIVTLRSGRVAVQLLSDSTENLTEVKSTFISGVNDITSFRRGDVATVVEVNPRNMARVKVLYQSGTWWGNVSDLLVID
jgi:glutamate 5-kinase